MALTTYAELVAAVLDAADREGAGWDTRARNAVRMAETDVSTQLRVRQMVCRARATITAEFTDLSADFGGVRALHLVGDPDQPMTAVSPAEMTRLQARNPAAGKPAWYAIVGETLQVCPAPDQPYTAEAILTEDIPALGDTRPSNWLLARFPHLYLMAALTWLARAYIGADPRLAEWGQGFEASLSALRSADAWETGHELRQRGRAFG